MAEHDAQALARAATVLMPKDWINLRLTGVRATDRTEASMSFLMDAATGDWSDALLALTGVPRGLLPPIRDPLEVIGPLAAEAAGRLGLPAGLPVLAGAGDYPAALLGSGVMAPGMASDVTGTSTIITLLHEAPVIDAQVSNVATVEGNWGSLTLLDAGGDAVRWARRAFHANRRGYDEVTQAAAGAEAGAGGLFFLPYLSGERFGEHRNSRAQFFGLTAAHGLPELHRAVLEGVAFSVRLDARRAAGRRAAAGALRRGGRRREVGALAADQGEHVRCALPGAARARMRRRRRRGDDGGGSRRRARSRGGGRPDGRLRAGGGARPGLGGALRPDDADLRAALPLGPGVLR